MGCHASPLKEAKKQGEMPLPIISPIPFTNVEFRDGWDWGWVVAFPLVSLLFWEVEDDRPSLNSFSFSEKTFCYNGFTFRIHCEQDLTHSYSHLGNVVMFHVIKESHTSKMTQSWYVDLTRTGWCKFLLALVSNQMTEWFSKHLECNHLKQTTQNVLHVNCSWGLNHWYFVVSKWRIGNFIPRQNWCPCQLVDKRC